MRQPRFVNAGHVIYPTRRAHANVVFDAFDSNAFVKLIGGDSWLREIKRCFGYIEGRRIRAVSCIPHQELETRGLEEAR